MRLIVRNARNDSPVSGVDVKKSDDQFRTDFNGECITNVSVGTYPFSFEKTGYLNISENFYIQSDTTIHVQLMQTHARVKFRIKNGDTPVNNAMVIINGDTTITNNIGLSTIDFLEIENNYEYIIHREDYQPVSGNLTIMSDTTVDINLALITKVFDELKLPIHLYPIPARNQLFIESGMKIYHLIICDIHGTIHRNISLNDKKGAIDLMNLVPGIYFLNIFFETGNEVKKIVIQ